MAGFLGRSGRTTPVLWRIGWAKVTAGCLPSPFPPLEFAELNTNTHHAAGEEMDRFPIVEFIQP